MASIISILLMLFALTFVASTGGANEFCTMRSLCPQGEHLGCSFNENSWLSARGGPIPLRRSSYVAQDEQKLILDAHNTLRRVFAKGANDSNNPPPRTISNMRQLTWNDQLAYLARVRVTLFDLGRSGSDCANLPKYQVGMNQYTQSFVVPPIGSAPWEAVTNYWYSFSRLVAYGLMSDVKAFRDLAQYSQMLWPSTYEMGCAVNSFMMPGAYMRNVVCLYGPVARCVDDVTNPFDQGEPASNCTAGTVPKDGLCASDEQTNTIAETTTQITTTATESEIIDCKSLGRCTEKPAEGITTTTTTEANTITPDDFTTTITTTTESGLGTDEEIDIGCRTLGRCTEKPASEEITTTTTTEANITPDDFTTTTTTTAPDVDCRSLGRCTKMPDDDNTDIPITTTTTLKPCNNSTTELHPVNLQNPNEVLYAILRYVCKLLSINPPDELVLKPENSMVQPQLL